MALISASRFNTLKEKIKAECLRRNSTGSVSSYGGTAYDYTTVPAADKVIKKEHYEKLINPLMAINSTVFPSTTYSQSGRIISGPDSGLSATSINSSAKDLTKMEAAVTVWSKINKYVSSANSGCSSSCTGLCATTCSDSCEGGCSGDCEGSCRGGCEGSCKGSHTTECNGMCWDGAL